jgi:hypothetical protein
MVPAVPVPIIVNPTCSGVMRRPPEWRPPDPTDNTTNHEANRPGEQQARPGTENRADVIRPRTRRSNGKGNQNWRCSQQSPAHSSSPVRLNVKSNTRAPDTQRSKRVGDFFPLDCCGTATRHTHSALAAQYPQNEILWPLETSFRSSGPDRAVRLVGLRRSRGPGPIRACEANRPPP